MEIENAHVKIPISNWLFHIVAVIVERWTASLVTPELVFPPVFNRIKYNNNLQKLTSQSVLRLMLFIGLVDVGTYKTITANGGFRSFKGS